MTKTWVDEWRQDGAMPEFRGKTLEESCQVFYVSEEKDQTLDLSWEQPYEHMYDFERLPPLTKEFVQPLRGRFHLKPFLPKDSMESETIRSQYRFISLLFFCLDVKDG